jgi:Asp-tRNA(Asn)/Glu-tRNA(Gln) amidotransferase A subunit family amidase
VPVLVKDNFDTHDMPTTGGSIALANSIPPDDAFMVQKLREAGAVLVAKTNMAEWAFSPRESISSSYGRTANAYDLTRVPAGSSGGTASGLAAGFAVAGLGSDTGNSIRGPSSHLSLVGIRSTFGLTSRDGVIPLAADRDIAGPMARSVSDVAAMFNVLAGYDPKDPVTEAGKGKREVDYKQFLDANSLQGARIGVLREWVDHENADPQITALFLRALDDMRGQGAVIIDPLVIPNIKSHLASNTFCPSFRYDMANYLKTLGDAAPIKDVAEVLKTKQYGEDAKGGLEFFAGFPADLPPEQWDEPCQRFWNNIQRQDYRMDVIAAMNTAKLDILVYPTWSNPPAHIDRGRAEYLGDNSQNLAPNTGLPAMTVPMGFSHDKWPAGLTMIARPFDEKTLFALGFAYEQATEHHKPPLGFD